MPDTLTTTELKLTRSGVMVFFRAKKALENKGVSPWKIKLNAKIARAPAARRVSDQFKFLYPLQVGQFELEKQR